MAKNDDLSRRAIRAIFDVARNDVNFMNKWLTADLWVLKLNSLHDKNSINVGGFNRFISDPTFGFPSCDNLLGTNTTGVFRMRYKRNNFFYFITNEKCPCRMAPTDIRIGDWVSRIKEESEELQTQISFVPNKPISTTESHAGHQQITTLESHAGHQLITTLESTSTSTGKLRRKRKSEVMILQETILFPTKLESKYKQDNPMKDDSKIKAAKKGWENFRSKATASLMNENHALRSELNNIRIITNELTKSNSSMEVLLQELLNERHDIIEEDTPNNSSCESRIKNLGILLGKHLSTEKKVVRIIKEVMTTYKLKELP